jgi:hypothetical protein
MSNSRSSKIDWEWIKNVDYNLMISRLRKHIKILWYRVNLNLAKINAYWFHKNLRDVVCIKNTCECQVIGKLFWAILISLYVFFLYFVQELPDLAENLTDDSTDESYEEKEEAVTKYNSCQIG